MSHGLFEKLFSLDGKVVFITGGYRGIGLTIAETYAAAGSNVVLAARNFAGCQAAAEKIAKTYGVRAVGKSSMCMTPGLSMAWYRRPQRNPAPSTYW